MKLNKRLFLIPLLCFMLTVNSFAHDTDLYTTATEGVKSNILFIIDNSCSMKSKVSTGVDPYDPNFNSSNGYPADPWYPNIKKNYVYEYTGSWDKTLQDLKVFRTDVNATDYCYKARNDLLSKGVTYNRYTNTNCDKTQKTLATGDFLNYYLYMGKWLPSLPKIDIAKRVITDILETMNGVNVGLMIFTPGGDGGKVITYIDDIDIDNHRAKIISDVNAIVNECGTPLGKTLYEAGLYFGGKPSYFNAPLNYSSVNPTQYSCQKNFAIFMTDGMASSDDDSPTPLPANIGDQNGDGKEPPVGSDHNDFLDDVAKYLYDNDINPNVAGTQNLVTYTIGFDIGSDADAKDLLARTALYGHGKFYMSQDALSLAGAFATAIDEVLAKTTSYVAPIVPVSRFEKTTAGDKIYIALFKPALMGMWKGNIKKYGVAQTMNPLTKTNAGDILDVSGKKALDADGKFYPSSKSYWSSVTDGGDVELGGVGDVLLRRTTARKIYTLLPGDAQDEDNGPDYNTSFDLTNSWNAFTTTNSRLTASTLGVPTDTDKEKLINFVHGYDAYDENGNGISGTDEKRSWILGSFIHSRPYIIHYKDRTVIYAGSNDGMLHAFNDYPVSGSGDGEELWAFIPPSLLGRLKELNSVNPGVFVDGSPKAYVTYDTNGNVTKAILVFGLRRGGNYYYALDVTNPLAPKYLWRIYKDKGGGFKELAQTWSAPIIGKVPYGNQTTTPPGEKWVVIFGGGYDTNQDSLNPASTDSIGRGVYMADVLTGSYVWWKSYPAGVTSMTHSIPSDVTKLDMDGDGRVDRLYVGDMKARMWRFDIGDLNKDGNSDPSEWTGRIIFSSNGGSTDKRKIFYPPDVTLENGYEMLFFGTGDREDPKCSRVPPDINRLYGLKDKNSMSIVTEADLEDVTEDVLQSGTSAAITVQQQLEIKPGWFIKVTKQTGESVLASPVVFYRTVYFTTFAPTAVSSTDPCLIGEGVAFLYALDYMNGNSVFNFDLTNDVGGTVLARGDRSLQIGTAIPSGVVITVVGNTAVGYAGVGGGIFRPKMKKTKVFYPLHWKIVF